MRRRLKPGTTERARKLRAEATVAERKLWFRLRELKRAGFHFRRQAPFRSYILDFVEHSAKLVIELDGSQHGLPENRARDAVRDRLLQSEGYRVLRFWNVEFLEDPDRFAEYIFSELGPPRVPFERSPHPKR